MSARIWFDAGFTPWSAKTLRMANSCPCFQASSNRSLATFSLAVTPRTSVGSTGIPPGDQRDRLDARGPGADDRDPLAGEVNALVGPLAGEVHLASEPVGALDIERLGHRKAAAGDDGVPAPQLGPAVGHDAPPLLLLVPACGGDGGAELDVRAQAVAVGHEPEVVQD